VNSGLKRVQTGMDLFEDAVDSIVDSLTDDLHAEVESDLNRGGAAKVRALRR
jgi:hypothetical protein